MGDFHFFDLTNLTQHKIPKMATTADTTNPDTTLSSADPLRSNSATADKPIDGDDVAVKESGSLSPPTSPRDRRESREWDASKVPPSQFQKRKGSIFATPGGRDGHVKGQERDKAFHDKIKEKAFNIIGKKI